MTANYYTRTMAFAERTRAKGEDVRLEYDAIDTSFDLVAADVDRAITLPAGTIAEITGTPAELANKVVGFDGSGVATALDINSVPIDGAMYNLIEDLTPQLGGNLDTQSFTIDGRDITVDGATLDSIDIAKLNAIEANANNYIHPTGDGSNHIPTAGTVGQILINTASGTATWQDEYTHPTGAGSEHLPTGGTVGQILTNTASGEGSWQKNSAKHLFDKSYFGGI